ncbi:hypothetical protein [Pseudonocardia sp. ICBG162]|uniref:hypothetical protein n=1 Tax=Pseudonocardia sp. ICBG162 TaxID=2846761 RepID=UPI001CF6EE85|nr:hypothetical protein [Pseudonocardia sp. ICBG162]
MPSNHRRKRDTRRRAARHGERYTRAHRVSSLAGAPGDLPTGPAEELDATEWQRDLYRIRALQQVVEGRGWVRASYALEDFDDDGHATTVDVCWDYPAAVAAPPAVRDQLPPDLREDDPCDPECSVQWTPELGLVARIRTAGNWGGCGLHRTDVHTVPLDGSAALRLARLLAAVERAARATDPGPLVDCTLRGACGQRAAERSAHRERIDSWTGALVEAARNFSPETMAELSAWEDEHLGRTVGPDGDTVGTSDWPGWIPLVGPPPWHRDPTADAADRDPVPVPAPDNDGVPIDLLRPVLDQQSLSAGAQGLWAMLVSFYWCCEDDRTVTQLHEHGPDSTTEIDMVLGELTAAGMVTVTAHGVVSIDPDHLGVIGPPQE